MTRTAIVYSDRTNGSDAGHDLGGQVRTALDGERPDAVVVFASSRFDYDALLSGIEQSCFPGLLVGSSSAGEFTSGKAGQGTACALAIKSDEIRMAAGLGHHVSRDRAGAAQDIIGAFRGIGDGQISYRTALVLTDALAGEADDLLDQLTIATSGQYQFAGGGAGDDARFARTHVFFHTRAYTDACVALELLTTKPVGVGVGHGWTPASAPLRVTETIGTRVLSLNGMAAVSAFERHAAAIGQRFDRNEPLPFFLHNILGIDTGNGYRLRVPLAVHEDGSVTCAAGLPPGSRVCIMKASTESAVAAAEKAAAAAVQGLHGSKPAGALLFDCVATRLRMGEAFGIEIDSVARMLGGAGLVGCNTYGQIARAEGQFGGFHNCTAVVMVLPS